MTVDPFARVMIRVRPGLVFDVASRRYVAHSEDFPLTWDGDEPHAAGIPVEESEPRLSTGPNSAEQPVHPYAEAVTHYQFFDWGFHDLAPADESARPYRLRSSRSRYEDLWLIDAAEHPDAFAAARLDPDMVAVRVRHGAEAAMARLEEQLGALPATAAVDGPDDSVRIFRIDGRYALDDSALAEGVEFVCYGSGYFPVWPTPGYRWRWSEAGHRWSWTDDESEPTTGEPEAWIPQPSELPFLPEWWQILVHGEIGLGDLLDGEGDEDEAAQKAVEAAEDIARMAAGEFSAEQIDLLAKRAITPEQARRFGVCPITLAEQLPDAFPTSSARRVLPGLLIPYTGEDGKTDHLYRPDTPVRIGDEKKLRKYVNPVDHRMPLAARRVVQDAETVLIVEGTFQAIAAAIYAPDGVAVYGIDGCGMWQEKKLPVPGLRTVSGRDVVIRFDADVDTNAHVRKQLIDMARNLLALGARSVRRAASAGHGTDGLDDDLGALPEVERTPFVARMIEEATDALAPHPADVLERVYQLEVGRAAEREVSRREAGTLPDPSTTGLADLLAEPDDAPVYRVSELWPTGGNVVLAAQRKCGKTTVIGNLVRCLADGAPFLGEDVPYGATGFSVAPLQDGERVGILDLELDRRTLRRWLRDQGIRNADRVLAVDLRGRVGEFNPLQDDRREAWAAHLREQNVRVLIIDPLAPLLAVAGVDENDNSGVAQLLAALDRLKAEAGISELLVAHHAGHANERSRGASRLRDWPDAEWRLVREQGETGQEPPPDAARFFLAEGRDVAVTEQLLAFDRATRRLVISGGNRAQHAATKYEPAVVEAVRAKEGLPGRALEEALCRTGMTQREARRALAATIAAGEVHTHAGERRARLHFLGGSCADCRDQNHEPLPTSSASVR